MPARVARQVRVPDGVLGVVVGVSERIFRCRDKAHARATHTHAWEAAKLYTDAYEIVIRPLKAKRSGDQNRRYWALLREVAAVVWVSMPINPDDRHSEWEQRQCDQEVWHMFFRKNFIGMDSARMPDGERIDVPISTTTLSVDDMGAYMRDIEVWCAEQGFPVMEAA